MHFNTIRFKISVLYTAILGGILLLYTAILYTTLAYNLYKEFDANLDIKAETVINTVESYVDLLGSNEPDVFFAMCRTIGLEVTHENERAIQHREKAWLKTLETLSIRRDDILFTTADGVYVVGSPHISEKSREAYIEKIRKYLSGEKEIRHIRLEGKDIRYLISRFIIDEREYIMFFGSSLEPVIKLMRLRFYYRLVPIPIILLIGFFVGGIFSNQILKPMKQVTTTAQRITHEALDERVETPHADEEIRYLVDAFNGMIARLEKAFEYITEMGSHVAHELKTPLAIVRGETEIVLRKDRSPEEYKRVFGIILDETRRMLRIIEDLLLQTRLDYQKNVLQRYRLNFTEFISEIIDRTKVMAEKKGITVETSVPKEDGFVSADGLQLRRSFFNIISNAITYTPYEGKITITVEYDKTHITVSIIDTGIGIAKKHIRRIFDKFYRVASSAEVSIKGTGLGLSIVRRIITLHGGRIYVHSARGQGSTFIVMLLRA